MTSSRHTTPAAPSANDTPRTDVRSVVRRYRSRARVASSWWPPTTMTRPVGLVSQVRVELQHLGPAAAATIADTTT
jgi:hypothetical protein